MNWSEVTYADLVWLIGFIFLGIVIGYVVWGR